MSADYSGTASALRYLLWLACGRLTPCAAGMNAIKAARPSAFRGCLYLLLSIFHFHVTTAELTTAEMTTAEMTTVEPPTNSKVLDAPICALMVAVAVIAVLVGYPFWVRWVQSPDHVICGVVALLGIGRGLMQHRFSGLQNRRRLATSLAFTLLGIATIALGRFMLLPELSSIAIGFLWVGWFGFVVRGESFMMGLLIGVLMMFPALLDTPVAQSAFAWLESITIGLTRNLCDTSSIPLALTEKGLWFQQGVAERFEVVGRWDSWVSLFGVCLYLLFSKRRNLMTVIFLLLASLVIWVTLRGGVWFALITGSISRGVWMDWTLWIQILAFLIATISVAGLSVFLSQVFGEIPVEHFTQTAPLVPYLWNWICGLPRLVYRVPDDSHIYKDWNTHLLMHEEAPSPRTDLRWFGVMVLNSLLHPLSLLGGAIDAFRGWRYSRDWWAIWKSIASCIVPVLAGVAIAIASFNRTESSILLLSEECERLISNDKLERIADHLQEEAFSKLAGNSTDLSIGSNELSAADKKSVELFSQRILQLQPKHPWATYRLAILAMLNENWDEGRHLMKRLASREFGGLPSAHEWMAKEKILTRSDDKGITPEDILGHIEGALPSRNLDGRLLRDYSRYLEGKGNSKLAVDLAKRAATAEPDLQFDLALLYSRMNHADLQSTAEQAESHYRKKLNLPSERESDRIAISRLCMLRDRVDDATLVLREGIDKSNASNNLRRELSELYRSLYRKSRKKAGEGQFDSDLRLLEKAVEVDPLNPVLSTEVAELLPLNIKPTPELLALLQDHIHRDITISTTHVLIGESYFDNDHMEDAMKHWNIALNKDPRNAIAMNNLAFCLSLQVPPDCEQALALLDRALALLPDNPHILDTQGGVLLKANRPKDAITKLERAIRINRDFPAARAKLIEAYRAVGMNEELRMQERLLRDLESKGSKPNKSVAIELPE